MKVRKVKVYKWSFVARCFDEGMEWYEDFLEGLYPNDWRTSKVEALRAAKKTSKDEINYFIGKLYMAISDKNEVSKRIKKFGYKR